MWLAQVGIGDVALALVPTFNLLVMAVVWKRTGKIPAELTGEIHTAKVELQHDLENGIRDAVETNTDAISKLQNDVTGIRTDVADIHDHIEREGLE